MRRTAPGFLWGSNMLPNIFFLNRREFLKKGSAEASSSWLCSQKKPWLLCTFKQTNNKKGLRRETNLAGKWTFVDLFWQRWPEKKEKNNKKKNHTPTHACTCAHTHTQTYSGGSSLIFLLGTLVVFLATSSGVATSYVRFKSMSPQSSGWWMRGGFSSSGAGLEALKRKAKLYYSEGVKNAAAATLGMWIFV